LRIVGSVVYTAASFLEIKGQDEGNGKNAGNGKVMEGKGRQDEE